MSKEELAQLIERIPAGMDADDFLLELARRIQAAERERCAVFCARQPSSWGRYFARLIRDIENGGIT